MYLLWICIFLFISFSLSCILQCYFLYYKWYRIFTDFYMGFVMAIGVNIIVMFFVSFCVSRFSRFHTCQMCASEFSFKLFCIFTGSFSICCFSWWLLVSRAGLRHWGAPCQRVRGPLPPPWRWGSRTSPKFFGILYCCRLQTSFRALRISGINFEYSICMLTFYLCKLNASSFLLNGRGLCLKTLHSSHSYYIILTWQKSHWTF